MKIQKNSFVSWYSCALGIFLAVVAQSNAQNYGLTNRNATLQINVASGPGGASNFQIDGVNQLYHHWFYYRVGGVGPEFPIENINGSPTINSYQNLSAFARLDVTYANASYSVNTLFQMTGQTAGTGRANLNETITVVNNSLSPLDFHLFQYSDFDLGGTPNGQSVQYFLNDVTGQYYKVTQTALNGASVTETITSASPPIGHFEANYFDSTFNSLTDTNTTILNDSISAGLGDVTFAYQWDVLLAPGASFQISKLIAVPEPSALALLFPALLAFLGFRLFRRNRRG